jgi:nitrous oxide reductase accessory protein NosL
MIRKGLGILFVACLLISSIAVAAQAADNCPLCGMTLSGNENTAFVVTMKTGEEVTYCCAHCGLWVMATEQDKVQSAKTRDFISGEWVDAAKAVYLHKSKAVPACAPSWIAFGSKKQAGMFQKGFGGKLYDYGQALKARAKEPKTMMEMHM